jgi:hypothetical protein
MALCHLRMRSAAWSGIDEERGYPGAPIVRCSLKSVRRGLLRVI